MPENDPTELQQLIQPDFERVAFDAGGGSFDRSLVDKQVRATATRIELMTVFPDVPPARATAALLKKNLTAWVKQVRSELFREATEPPFQSREEAEQWIRAGDTWTQFYSAKRAGRTSREAPLLTDEELAGMEAELDRVNEILDSVRETYGFTFGLAQQGHERLPIPQGDNRAPLGPGDLVSVWADSRHGRLAQAVEEISEYSGYSRRDLILYVLIDEEPTLDAAALKVWWRWGPPGAVLPMNSYATIRLNSVPTTRELQELHRTLVKYWEKPGEREERVFYEIVEDTIGKPGAWKVEQPWAIKPWREIASEWEARGMKPNTPRNLRKNAYLRYQKGTWPPRKDNR
jgi:hypothetical protein